MGLTFQWAEEKDIPKLRRFFSENFGTNCIQSAPGRFEALFLNHPLGFNVLICLSGEEIAGIRCFLPVKIGFDNKVVNSVFSVDTMVSPRFRKQGIAQNFLETALKRFPLVIASGPTLAHAELYKKLGGTIVSSFNKAYLVRKPKIQDTLRSTARDFFAWLLWLKSKRVNSSHNKITLDSAVEIIDSLPSRLSEKESGSQIDRDTFLWRFGGPFYNDYSFYRVNSGKYQGLLVARCSDGETKIIDIFCCPEALESILKAACDIMPKEKITAVFAGRNLERKFYNSGFLVRSYDATLVIIAADLNLQNELSNREWIMFSGDADGDLLSFPKSYESH